VDGETPSVIQGALHDDLILATQISSGRAEKSDESYYPRPNRPTEANVVACRMS
jgi:hypothetical protein